MKFGVIEMHRLRQKDKIFVKKTKNAPSGIVIRSAINKNVILSQ